MKRLYDWLCREGLEPIEIVNGIVNGIILSFIIWAFIWLSYIGYLIMGGE